MKWGSDDHEMWTVEQAEEIQRQANQRGHSFSCECPACRRTKTLEKLLKEHDRR